MAGTAINIIKMAVPAPGFPLYAAAIEFTKFISEYADNSAVPTANTAAIIRALEKQILIK
jgi:hypothetical protein